MVKSRKQVQKTLPINPKTQHSETVQEKDKPDNKLKLKKQPSLAWRIMLSFALLIVLVAASYYIKNSQHEQHIVPKSRLTKLDTSINKYKDHKAKHGKMIAPQVELLASYPHDKDAFTQGLLLARQGVDGDKFFIESTGMWGRSSVRKVAIETGVIEVQYDLNPSIFAEGITLKQDGTLVLLTWQQQEGLVIDYNGDNEEQPFFEVKQFNYKTSTGEGWGIDADGDRLFVSDGSATIAIWNASTLEEISTLDVSFQGRPISHVNELEVAKEYLYANIWFQQAIVKIDKITGEIVKVFDCSALVQEANAPNDIDAVMNGIAYDPEEDVFYITGKMWQKMFKVRFIE